MGTWEPLGQTLSKKTKIDGLKCEEVKASSHCLYGPSDPAKLSFY